MKRILLAIAVAILGNFAAAGEKYALLVGVTEYEHPKFKTLKYAENDVAELGQVLAAGGFKVTQLSENAKDAKLKPKRENIVRELDQMLAKCTRRDMILVALSGHGMQPAGSKENFFCPSDARAHDLKTLVGMADLYEKLDHSAAETKLMLIDACRDDPVGGKGITKVPLPPEGVGVLLSCSPGEQAYESKDMQHGVFFYWLLDGLRGKAANDEDQINFGLLAEYVQRRVARSVPTMVGEGAKQSPNLVANISGESPLLVTASKKSNANGKPDVPPGETDAKSIPKTESRETGVRILPKPPADGKPTAREIVGGWGTSSGTTIHFRADNTLVYAAGTFYLSGKYSCEHGILDMSFNEVNWDIRFAMDWGDPQKSKLAGSIVETNFPMTAVGHRVVWQRINQAEPAAPPTRKELVGTWFNNQFGTSYTMKPDHTFVVRFNGGQMTGRYGYNGNVLLVRYDGTNEWSLGNMTWVDPKEKTTVRSTIVASNVQGGSPPGTSVDFVRMK